MRLSENFSFKTRPRQDKFQNFVRDWDEAENLGTFSLKTKTRLRLASVTESGKFGNIGGKDKKGYSRVN